MMHNKQQGFTLTELMIAMTISSIMMAAAVTQLVTSKELFVTQEADARIEENARYALEVLTNNIRMAAYVDSDNALLAAPRGQFFNGVCSVAFNPCTDDGVADHLAVWVNPPQEAFPSTDRLTCAGIAIPVAFSNDTIANVFYIANDNGFNSLRCTSFIVNTDDTVVAVPDSTHTIIEGIENMQILYGLNDRSFSNTAPVRYVSADTVNAIAVDPALKTGWSSVSSVRITLLVATGYNDNGEGSVSKTYQLADAPDLTFNDGNRRRVYSSTVMINNANL